MRSRAANRRAALAWVAIGDEARRRLDIGAMYSSAVGRVVDRLAEDVGRLVPRKRVRPLARAIMVAIEGALRVGAGGGLEPAAAAPLVRGMAAALLNDAAASP